jgi:hypothetical protein
MPWLPESPRWLLAVDREDQAWEIVKRLHSTKDDPEHEYATGEFYQMKTQHNLDRGLDGSWLEMFRRPSYRRRALLSFFLPVIIYTTGNLVITSMSPFVSPFLPPFPFSFPPLYTKR